MWLNQQNVPFGYHNKQEKEGKTQDNNHLENVMIILNHQQETITQIRKELQRKVNKIQLKAHSNENQVSAFQLTALSIDHLPSDLLENTSPYHQSLIYHHNQFKKDVDLFKAEIRQAFSHLQKCVLSQKMNEFVDQMRESTKICMLKLDKKCQRTELDKTMHLTSLLAIQFELIKKRFNIFQTDYNSIWKEISKLYTHQQTLRSAFQTERKDNKENTNEKYLQVLFKNSRNPICTNLFQSYNPSSYQEEGYPIEQSQRSYNQHQNPSKSHDRLQELHKKLSDQQLSIKILSQKLTYLEQSYDKIQVQKVQMAKIRKQLTVSQEQFKYLINKNEKMERSIEYKIEQKLQERIRGFNVNISEQIRESCEQTFDKMMTQYVQCAKKDQLGLLAGQIKEKQNNLQQKLKIINEKMHQNAEKNRQIYDLVIKKSVFHENYLRDLQRQTKTLIKMDYFQQNIKKYVKSQVFQTTLKKQQNTYKQQIKKIVSNQQQINEIVCSQNIVMRWIWVSGELKGGNLVSWDRQVINTLPQNFIYKKDEYLFNIITSGIYKIQMGFYAKKKPAIQVIINGQTIMSAVNSNSYVLHHSSGKLKDISNSQITGITYYDYYTIQQNSRIAISYCGQIGHGFIGIQRL